MGAHEGMGRRLMKTGEEYDVHTAWRQLLCYMQRPGVASRAKRRSRRRERHQARAALARDPWLRDL